jgi:hypothetical protein
MVNVDNRGTGPRDPRGSNSSLYFIVGALVVAVLIIGWFLYGRDGAGVGTATTGTPASTSTNVTVDTPAAPAAGDNNTTVNTPAAPAADTAAPAAPAAPAAGDTAAPAAPAGDTAAPAAPAAPATEAPATPAAPAPQ